MHVHTGIHVKILRHYCIEACPRFLRSKWLRSSRPHGSVFRNHNGSKIHGHMSHIFITIHKIESIDRFPTPKKDRLRDPFLFLFHYSQAGTMVPLYFSAMNFLTDSD